MPSNRRPGGFPLPSDPARTTRLVATAVVAVVAVVLAAGLTGSMFSKTAAGEVGVVRNGGPFDNNRIRGLLAPGSGLHYVGYRSRVHTYPSQQRFYTITSDAGRGDRAGVDVEHDRTSDGVEVGVEGTIYFTLNQDRKVLYQFDDKFGTRQYRGADGGLRSACQPGTPPSRVVEPLTPVRRSTARHRTTRWRAEGRHYGRPVHIRGATDEDWPAIYEIVRAVVSDGRTYAYPEDLTSDAARELWIMSPPARTIVAVDGEVVVGTATMTSNRPGRGSHIATASFMVSPSARRRGVGRALGEHVLEWARQQRYRGIQFNAVVERNVAAVRLWRSLGFEIIGTVPGAFRHPDGGYAGLHVMFRTLTQVPAPVRAPDGRVRPPGS